MSETMNLYQKISAVMKDIQYLQKDDKVSTGANSPGYKAMSEEKVTQTVRESLITHGLIILPVAQSHNREELRDKDNMLKGYLSIVDTQYKIVDVDTGQFELLASSGTGADSQDKGVGKAMTYSYKYLLLRTFAIPTGDDPDKVSSATLDEQHEREKRTAQPQQTAQNTTNSAPQGKKCEYCKGTGRVGDGMHANYECSKCNGTGNTPQTARKPAYSQSQHNPPPTQPEAQQSRSNVPHSFKSEAYRLRIEHHMEWKELQSVAERILGRKLKKVTELQDDKEWELIVNELKSFNLELPF